MIALLRNCSHGSEVATYAVHDESGRRFVKVALTPEGREALRSELRGWTFYQSLRWPGLGSPRCRVLRDDAHVLRIETDAVDGRRGRAAGGVRDNRALLQQAVDQYCAIWPAGGDGSAPLHGDFSCDNLFATADGPVAIDWEHFHLQEAPWGFDAVYLLLESLYFDVQRDRRVDSTHARFVAERLAQLAATGHLPADLARAPVAFTRTFIRTSRHLWRDELQRFPMKLPVAQWSDAEGAAIDVALSGASRHP